MLEARELQYEIEDNDMKMGYFNQRELETCDCEATEDEVLFFYREKNSYHNIGCNKCVTPVWISDAHCPNCKTYIDKEHEMVFYQRNRKTIGCEDCLTIAEVE